MPHNKRMCRVKSRTKSRGIHDGNYYMGKFQKKMKKKRKISKLSRKRNR